MKGKKGLNAISGFKCWVKKNSEIVKSLRHQSSYKKIEIVYKVYRDFICFCLSLFRHSLLATHLLLKVNNSFHVNLTVQDLFASPTVAEMAKMIDELKQNGSQKNK